MSAAARRLGLPSLLLLAVALPAQPAPPALQPPGLRIAKLGRGIDAAAGRAAVLAVAQGYRAA